MNTVGELEELAREMYAAFDDACRHIGAGYDAGINVQLREFHDRLPLHLHPRECDGCAYAWARDFDEEADDRPQL